MICRINKKHEDIQTRYTNNMETYKIYGAIKQRDIRRYITKRDIRDNYRNQFTKIKTKTLVNTEINLKSQLF